MKQVQPIQHDGSWQPIIRWLRQRAGSVFVFQSGEDPPVAMNEDGSLTVRTKEGLRRAGIGDWLSSSGEDLVVTKERP